MRPHVVVLGALLAFLGASSTASASVDYVKQWYGSAQFSQAYDVAVGPSGTAYVADTASNRVQLFDSDGAFLGELGQSGTGEGAFQTPYSVATDSSGNLYVADESNARIQKFTAGGSFLRMWGWGVDDGSGALQVCTSGCEAGIEGSGDGQLDHPWAIAVDSADNVYVADGENHRVQKFDSNGAFLRMWGWGVDDGTAAFQTCTGGCLVGISGSGDGQFPTNIFGIDTDSSSNVYVVDSDNRRIQKFSSSGSFLTKWGSFGSGENEFNSPHDVAVDSSNNVYVSDVNRVHKFDSTGSFLRMWGWGVDDGTAAFQTCTSGCQAGIAGPGDGQMDLPRGMGVDGTDTLYVADNNNDRIQKFTSAGGFVRKWGLPGPGISGCCGFPNGPPHDLATDVAGNVYVADVWNTKVQVFDPLGGVLRTWGTFGAGDTGLDDPKGIAVDSSGNSYVAGVENDRVTKFSSAGVFLRMWGWGVDNGTAAFQICTGGCQTGIAGAGAGQFSNPQGVATDSTNVYVADTTNNRIQKFDSSGAFLMQWGSPGSGMGQFSGPRAVAADGAGNVYVADTGNNRIQRFDSSGAFVAQWGTAGTGAGQFASPDGVGLDPFGNVYVADTGNNRVQVFRPTGVFIKQWGSSGSATGQFSAPRSVATGPAGAIYVMDTSNARVQKFVETDQTAPDTTVDSAPPNPTNDTTPTFAFSSSQPAGALFECRLDSAAEADFAPCSSPHATSVLTDGSHTFEMRAIDSAGNPDATPASRTFTVDTVAPDTQIDSGPAGPIATRDASFAFSASEAASFECSIDGGAYSSCASPQGYANLADGAHSFAVRATDTAGNLDASPATRVFTVAAGLPGPVGDVVAPQTRITKHPPKRKRTKRARARAKFSFRASEAGSSFACKLDRRRWKPCSPPRSFRVKPGRHRFRVRATDVAGNTDPTPATFRWRVRRV